MPQQQTDQDVRREILAMPIHAADAIGVAIGDEAKIMRMLLEKSLTATVVRFDGFGIDAAEQWDRARR
jgi:hypothetical protein